MICSYTPGRSAGAHDWLLFSSSESNNVVTAVWICECGGIKAVRYKCV